MECNKDEAIRAKAIAEQKMQAGDFPGARRIALKARQLYPDLENLSQLLTVCEVHCSAQDRVNGSEMDWYGILQVEKFSDETIIKKQFRKLALSLHPDKNKFAGAEAAFKLIGEAQRVLTDPTKRPLYDMKCKGSIRSVVPKPPAPNQFNRSSDVTKQQRAANRIPNNPYAQFTGFHPVQTQQRPTFWTSCPSCNTRYQYYIEFVGKMLLCQTCQHNFVAHDMGSNGIPSASPRSQFTQKGIGNQGSSKGAPQKDGGKPSSMSFPDGYTKDASKPNAVKTSNVASSKPDESKAGSSTVLGGGSKSEEKSNGHVDVKAGERHVPLQDPDATKSKKSESSKGVGRKRGRKSFEDTNRYDDSDDDEVMEGKGIDLSAQSSGSSVGRQTRRSSRQKRQVSYDENVTEDADFASSSFGRSKGNKSSGATEEVMKKAGLDDSILQGGCWAESTAGATAVDENKAAVNKKTSSTLQQSHSGKKDENRYHDAEVGGASLSETDGAEVESEDGIDRIEVSEVKKFEFPEQDFSNFDEEREEKCFAVNQVWACYDPLDGMPRYYAQVKKVFLPGFKLKITWLETDPDDIGEHVWCEAKLPVACGKYKLQGTQTTEDRLMFSHQIHCIRGVKGSHFVYPQKGETWAVFKNWDIKWGSDPQKHKPPYQFEIVEILTDFDKNIGIRVAYLEKVKAFVSIFKQAGHNGVLEFCIPPGELYRFSHRIPSFKMTGKEGDSVREGFMELDTASLSPDLFEGGNPGGFMEEDDSDKVVNGGRVTQSEVRTGQGITTPRKQEKGEHVQDVLKLRRSPRDFGKRNSQVCATQSTSKEDTVRHAAKINGLNFQATSSANHSDDKLSTTGLSKSPLSRSGIVIEVDCYDFNKEKSADKFQVDQVWALYSAKDGLPKDFAVVKKIDESTSFRLHVAMLEACSPPTNMVHSVCFGTFKVNNAKSKVLPPAAFSHQLKVDMLGKNRYNIYPGKGDVWAMYKNPNSGTTHSDKGSDECDLVEVLEATEHGAKVLFLTQIKGTESFYWSARNQRSKRSVMDVPRSEFSKFSHSCSAIQHNGEKHRRLKDCWEIDPSSIPGTVILLD